MKEFKGTKGKWKARNLFDNWIISDEKDLVLNIVDNEANAKLIASAPELLEALIQVTSSLEKANELLEKKGVLLINDNTSKAKEIINKALGVN